MNSREFDKVMNDFIGRCQDVLGFKGDEYGVDDRHHNFRVAATLKGEDPVKALSGMMVKHTVSIYDMMNDYDPLKEQDMNKWMEKIGDHANYLFLLWALILGDNQALTQSQVICKECFGEGQELVIGQEGTE